MSADNSSYIPTVLILGAGFIGSYLGAHLATRPDFCTPHLIGRRTHFDAIRKHGSLSATSKAGKAVTIPAEKLHLHESIDAYCNSNENKTPDYIIITVKRTTAKQAYQDIKRWDGVKGITVVTMMNGAGARDEARDALPNTDIIDGMWPFNVVDIDSMHYLQASGGDVFLGDTEAGAKLAHIFTACGVATQVSHDMDGILYGKLLLNLHNAISALTGLPIQQELSTHSARKVWARCITETLEIYRANGINPVSFLPLIPYSILPYLLSLPNFLFLRIATRLLSLDPRATSSMYEDLKRGRQTEIDYLQGEVVRLGKEVGIAAPVCERVVALVKEHEAKGEGVGNLTGEMILDALELI